MEMDMHIIISVICWVLKQLAVCETGIYWLTGISFILNILIVYSPNDSRYSLQNKKEKKSKSIILVCESFCQNS